MWSCSDAAGKWTISDLRRAHCLADFKLFSLDTWGFSEGGISGSGDRLQVLHIQLYAASIHALHTIF